MRFTAFGLANVSLFLMVVAPFLIGNIMQMAGIQVVRSSLGNALVFVFLVLSFLAVLPVRTAPWIAVLVGFATMWLSAVAVLFQDNNFSNVVRDMVLFTSFALGLIMGHRLISILTPHQLVLAIRNCLMMSLFVLTAFALVSDHSIFVGNMPVVLLLPIVGFLSRIWIFAFIFVIGAFILPQIGYLTIGLALYVLALIVTVLFRLLGGGLSATLSLVIIFLLVIYLTRSSSQDLIYFLSHLTNYQSAAIRLSEFISLLDRPAMIRIFGGGLGYENERFSFSFALQTNFGITNSAELLQGGRLRVYHFAFSFVFAKFGYIGLAGLILITWFVVLRVIRLVSQVRCGDGGSFVHFLIFGVIFYYYSFLVTAGATLKDPLFGIIIYWLMVATRQRVTVPSRLTAMSLQRSP